MARGRGKDFPARIFKGGGTSSDLFGFVHVERRGEGKKERTARPGRGRKRKEVYLEAIPEKRKKGTQPSGQREHLPQVEEIRTTGVMKKGTPPTTFRLADKPCGAIKKKNRAEKGGKWSARQRGGSIAAPNGKRKNKPLSVLLGGGAIATT